MNVHARFTHMQDGTQEDWAIIAADFSAYCQGNCPNGSWRI